MVSTDFPKLIVAIFVSCLSSNIFADTKYQSAKPIWQKEFGYEGFSCFPHLLNTGNNDKVIVIGSMYNQRDHNSVGRIWQWTLNKETGERLDDITLKNAKPKDCIAISSFWVTKGLDVVDNNEIQLFIDPVEHGQKQAFIKKKKGHFLQMSEAKIENNKSSFFAGRMKRLNTKEYFLFGSNSKNGNAVIQKRNNNGDVIWEKEYQYGTRSYVSDLAQSKSNGLIVISGWAEDKNDKSCSAWINTITDDGTVITREVFNINTIDLIRVPQVTVLDNNNIVIVYDMCKQGQSTDIEYRIYSKNLDLKLKNSVYTCKTDFLYYGMVPIDGGFVIIHDVLESDVQYEVLNQYDCDGKQISAIKIDGVGVLGDQVLIESEGKMIYLASLKTPPLPLTKAVITALQLK